MCSAFRNITNDATFVMLKVMPNDILANEITNIYNRKSINRRRDQGKGSSDMQAYYRGVVEEKTCEDRV